MPWNKTPRGAARCRADDDHRAVVLRAIVAARAWHRSPLLRRRDRLESTAALVVVVFVVMMVPLAATVGTVTYGTLVEQARQDIHTHRQVEATVLDSAPTVAAAPETAPPLPPAVDQTELRWVRWNVDGHTHTGRLSRPLDAQPRRDDRPVGGPQRRPGRCSPQRDGQRHYGRAHSDSRVGGRVGGRGRVLVRHTSVQRAPPNAGMGT